MHTSLRAWLSKIILVFVTFSIMVSFQNCGKGFKSAGTLDSSSNSLAAEVPQILFIAGSATVFNLSTNSLQFSVLGSNLKSITCQLNVAAAQDCSSQIFNFVSLVDGDYTLKVLAETHSGLKSEAVWVFRIDTTAPVVQISSKPPGITNQTTAGLIFSIAESSSGLEKVECALDAAAFAACVSPVYLNALAVGNHTFKIRAADKAGNVSSEALATWVVDLNAPTVIFTGLPPTQTSNTTAAFVFSGTGIVSYECQLDAAAFAACTSPVALSGLTSASHTFTVRGRNAAGSVSAPLAFSWIVDTVAPAAPTIAANVMPTTNMTSVSLSFSSVDVGSGIQNYYCAFDSVTYTECTSPFVRTGLSPGLHIFRVRSSDFGGNSSLISTFSWTVDLSPPTLIFSQVPAKIQGPGSSVFNFAASDSDGVASVQCHWISPTSSTAPVNCTGGITLSLPPGAYVLNVVTTDNSGNSSTHSYAWDIDDGTGTILKLKSLKGRWVHACGITMTDTVKCWGNGVFNDFLNDSSIAIDQPGVTGAVALTVGGWHKCALLTGGRINCWGQSNYGLYGDHGLTGVLQVEAGWGHTCVLLAGGTVKCWGNNSSGQAGHPSLTVQYTPVDVPGISGAKFISAGDSETCVITATDTVKCWGAGANPVNGADTSVPTDVPGLSQIKFVSVGHYRESCAIDQQNVAWCWTSRSPPAKVPGLPPVKTINAEYSASCAAAIDGRTFCWGSNESGQLATRNPKTTFTEIAGLKNVKGLALGNVFTCFLTEENSVKCSGNNETGALGYSKTTVALAAVPFNGLSDVKEISGHGQGQDICALSNNGTVKCWGTNLGNGTDDRSDTPITVPGLSGIKSLSVGQDYTCVITATDTVKCWGRTGSSTTVKVPTDIAGIAGVKSVQTGWQHACALLSDNTVKCWGQDPFYGALGNGPVTSQATPTLVQNLSDVASLAGTNISYCAILNNGTVKCWGYNFQNTPQVVPSLAGMKSISRGEQSFCGIDSLDRVQCWGGVNLETIGGLSGFTKVFPGFQHHCAMDNLNNVRCWGDNTFGQLGNNYTLPAPSRYSAMPMTLNKPVVSVFAGKAQTYLLYADQSVGIIGQLQQGLYALSPVLKDPR